jgi:hypothetical protein
MRKLTISLLSALAVFILLPSNLLGQTPRTATATATVVNGFVVSITVTDGGFGYTTAPAVKINSATGSGAVAIATITDGVVTKIVVMEVGSGYGANPLVSIAPPASTRAASATATVANGFLISVAVTDGGFGYGTPPEVTIEGGTGSGAVLKALIVNRAVSEIIVEDAGKGYPPDTKVTVSPPGAPTAPFSEGLVAYYPFNSTVRDESGNGIDGANLEGAFGADRFGEGAKSLALSGQAYVFVNNAPSLQALEYLTISAWVKHEMPANSSGMSIISKVSDDQSDLSWNLGIVPPGKLRVAANAGGWGYFDCNTVLEPGVWHHVALVYDGVQLMGYVDGLLDGAIGLKGTLAPSTRPVRIGVYSVAGSPNEMMFFKGQIDELRIYGRGFSAVEMADLYHYEAPEAPWVALSIKTIRVTLHVKPSRTYQLQASRDLVEWINVEEPFLAMSSEVVQDFDALDGGRYFRVNEVGH